MTWTYSGNPANSEKDLYRFLVGDVNPNEPILQDEEIEYVIGAYKSQNVRLYHLFSACALFFARRIKRKVGPIEEDPYERQRYFEEKAAKYRMLSGLSMSSGFSKPPGKPIFKIGMDDNRGGY